MAATTERLVAVDWLRGLVMVLMAIDHVDHATNPDHALGDSAMVGVTGPLSAPDFLVRWLSHLCAPTFVLLAGVSVALSTANARRRGTANGMVDRHLLLRGAVIIGLELTLVSQYWRSAEGHGLAPLPVYFQVLWAIGGGIALAPLLRRLPSPGLLAGAAVLLLGAELARAATLDAPLSQPWPLALLLVGGPMQWTAAPRHGFDAICIYPLLAWLPVLMIGIVLGRGLLAAALSPRRLVTIGVACLLVFLLLRGLDGFGNMGLHRRDGSVLEWLHCSRYPPSLTYLAMELGLALSLLGLFTAGHERLARLPDWNPLTVLGQVPLFYYLLHLPVIGLLLATGVLPDRGQGSAFDTLWATAIVVAVCWPVCIGYGWYKRGYRHAWTRYV